MNPLPIIFLQEHKPFSGTSVAIAAAQHWNPHGRVVFIGDQQQPRFPCETFSAEAYSATKHEFQKIYQGKPGPNEWFVWITLAEWLVACEWMTIHNVERALVLDTDVLLFCDAYREGLHWEQYDVTLSLPPPHKSSQAPLFVSLPALQAFVDWLYDLFEDRLEYSEKIIASPFESMSLWQDFAGHNPQWKVGNTAEVVNGSTWDHNLAMSYDDYEMSAEGKVVHFHGGQPYVKRNGDLIRFNALHCWGVWKQRMPELWERSFKARE